MLKGSITKPVFKNDIEDPMFSQMYQNRVLITLQQFK